MNYYVFEWNRNNAIHSSAEIQSLELEKACTFNDSGFHGDGVVYLLHLW